MASRIAGILLAYVLASLWCGAASAQTVNGLTTLSKERLVLQMEQGDLHLAFYPDVRKGR